MMNANRNCVLCVLVGLILSGLFGALTGSTFIQFGFDHSIAGAMAGVVGSLATQAFNLVCLLLAQRYKSKPTK